MSEKKSNTLVVPAFVKTFRGLADGSMSVTFETLELSPEDHAKLGQSLKTTGVLVFKPKVNELSKEELKAIEAVDINNVDDPNHKTHSQRFRAVMYRMFQQDPEGYKGFDGYYSDKMESLIGHYKKKLDS